MITRITDFSHIVPVSKIDITVGMRAPRLGDDDHTTTVPVTGDVRPLALRMGVDPPAETEFRPRSDTHPGFIIDVFA